MDSRPYNLLQTSVRLGAIIFGIPLVGIVFFLTFNRLELLVDTGIWCVFILAMTLATYTLRKQGKNVFQSICGGFFITFLTVPVYTFLFITLFYAGCC